MVSKTWLLIQVWISFSAASILALDITPKVVQIDVQSFWTADVNRAQQGQVVLDFQQHTKVDQNVDLSKNPLFKQVDQELFKKPTYEALIQVFNEYDAPPRMRSPAKLRASLDNFLNKISETTTFKDLQKVLKDSGYEPASDDAAFRKAVEEMWFGEYTRAHQKSSGFEHVFIGELKHKYRVDGLHNWVRMYWLESKKKFDYAGYIYKQPRVAAIKFQLGGHWKELGSMMIGTSPEFDFAVFTLCFVGRRGGNACKFFLGDCSPVGVTSFDMRGTNFIGTVYPTPWKTHAQCPVMTEDSDEGEGTVAKRKHREELFTVFNETLSKKNDHEFVMAGNNNTIYNNANSYNATTDTEEQLDDTVDVDFSGEWEDDWAISADKWFNVDED